MTRHKKNTNKIYISKLAEALALAANELICAHTATQRFLKAANVSKKIKYPLTGEAPFKRVELLLLL